MSVDTRLRRLAAFLAAGLVAVVGLVFEALLFCRGDDKLGILCFSNAITGVVAGALYVQSRLREWEKQQVLEERLRKIADMNHHVRKLWPWFSSTGCSEETATRPKRLPRR